MDTKIEKENMEFQELLKTKANKTMVYFLIRLFIVLVVFISLSIYLFTPISSLNNTFLEGNIYFAKEDILDILNHDEKDSLYKIDERFDELLLNGHPLIENANIKLSPFNMIVAFDECAPSAQYENLIYHTQGTSFTEEEMNNQIINDYLSEHDIFYAKYLVSPELISKGYNARLLQITAFSNKLDNIIYYLDIDKNEKTFIFYYFVDSNLPLLRVNFNCSDNISGRDFSNVVTKDVITKTVNMLKDRSATIKTISIDEESFTYFDTDLSFDYTNGEVSAKFNYR